MDRVCRARTVSVDNAKARLLCFTEDKIDADEPFRGRLNEGDLVAFSVNGNPVPLTVLGS